ncbi:MAG: hypothetical protein IJZ04_09675 [Clostridia bacterium]|nr:hypothetical protein [Clostridia bacterium]MBQ8739744.1 hypothetical protein [Clostridia bacterium]
MSYGHDMLRSVARYVSLRSTRYGLCESSICNFVALDSLPRLSVARII